MGLGDYGWMITNYVFNQSMVTIVWLDESFILFVLLLINTEILDRLILPGYRISDV